MLFCLLLFVWEAKDADVMLLMPEEVEEVFFRIPGRILGVVVGVEAAVLEDNDLLLRLSTELYLLWKFPLDLRADFLGRVVAVVSGSAFVAQLLPPLFTNNWVEDSGRGLVTDLVEECLILLRLLST
jgi:hypothetical protein